MAVLAKTRQNVNLRNGFAHVMDWKLAEEEQDLVRFLNVLKSFLELHQLKGRGIDAGPCSARAVVHFCKLDAS